MPRTVRFDLRITSDEKAVWGAAAARAGLSLNQYIRAQVNKGITAATAPPGAPMSPIATPAERPAVAPTASQLPVAPLHPLAALFPVWPIGLCADCTRQGSPCCVRCRVRNGLAI